MAVKIRAAKPKAEFEAPHDTQADSPVAELHAELKQEIDELSTLYPLIEKMKAQVKEFEERRVALAAKLSETDVANDDKVSPFKGNVHAVFLQPAALRRFVEDKPGLIQMLGQDTFNLLAEVKLTDLDKYLSPSEQAGVIGKKKIARVVKFG